MKPVLLLLLLASSALAGCVSDDEPQDTTGAEPDLPQLHGWMFDSAVAPIQGVDLEVNGGNVSLNVQTDAEGFYGLNDLPQGVPLTLIARAEGFVSQAKQTTLNEGTTVQMNFTMVRVPVITPYHETLGPFKGLIQCQYTVEASEDWNNNECGAGNNDNEWLMTVGEDFAGGVIEIDWNDNTPVPTQFRATIECATPGKCGDNIQPFSTVIGPSRLRLEIGSTQAATYFPDGGMLLLKVYVDPNNDANEASTGASAAVNQPFEAIASMFYHAPPPAGYSVD